MKTLHLIRHAKSSNGGAAVSDIDRPLNNRGKRSCQIMAQHIVDAGCDFDNVFCSTAKRAQMTIMGINQALEDKDIKWSLDDDLYTFDSQAILQWCQRLDDSLNNVVVVGHNPALTEFCNYVGDRYIENMPTCGYVQLSIHSGCWRDLGVKSGKLVNFLVPPMFKDHSG